MPEISVNRNTKLRGLQTFADASRLCPELREAELEYVGIRNYYIDQLAIMAQLQEELQQQKAVKNKERVVELGNKIISLQSVLKDMRERVRLAGERSWSEAFVLASHHMLRKEIIKSLSIAADNLIGRGRHELSRENK